VRAADAAGKQLEWMTLRDAKSLRNWTQWNRDIAPPQGAASFTMTMTLEGQGRAWLDDVTIESAPNIFPVAMPEK